MKIFLLFLLPLLVSCNKTTDLEQGEPLFINSSSATCGGFQMKLVPLDTALCDCLKTSQAATLAMFGLPPNNILGQVFNKVNGEFITTNNSTALPTPVAFGFVLTLKNTDECKKNQCFRFQVHTRNIGQPNWTIHSQIICVAVGQTWLSTRINYWGDVDADAYGNCVFIPYSGYLYSPLNDIDECGDPTGCYNLLPANCQ